MSAVTQYTVAFYGTQDGYQYRRAQINLKDGNTLVGYIYFHDEGMPFPDDSEGNGVITLHLPSSMFENVLDVLRNEEPVHILFGAGHARLITDIEPVGESE